MRSSSWQILSDSVVIKRIDKSFMLHEGTSIPKEILDFFSSSTLKRSEQHDLVLNFKGTQINAYIQLGDNENPYARMFWRSSNLSRFIKDKYPDYDWEAINAKNYDKDRLPFVSYKKFEEDIFFIDVISNTDIQFLLDIESFNEENEFFEGKRKGRFTSYYERNPQLRTAAVKIHGTKCKVCGFDFEKIYGKRGIGYIEVHHLVLVSSLMAQIKVDPKNDMTVVCSNCHRMIHRNRDNILTPDELAKLINKIY